MSFFLGFGGSGFGGSGFGGSGFGGVGGFVLQDDLLTRWINGVRGRLIDATYSLSITIGQGQQTLPEILEWWTVQFPNVHIVILAPEMPQGLEKWQGIVEFREFSCA
jgi:hypothetical protein